MEKRLPLNGKVDGSNPCGGTYHCLNLQVMYICESESLVGMTLANGEGKHHSHEIWEDGSHPWEVPKPHWTQCDGLRINPHSNCVMGS